MSRVETPTEMMDDLAAYAERQIAPIYHRAPEPEQPAEPDTTTTERT